MKRIFLCALLLVLNFSAIAQDQDPCYSVNDFITQMDIKTPISYQLSSGWNMVGYTGTSEDSGIVSEINASLSNDGTAESTFQVIKNVSGQFWSSAFAQLTNFTQGEAYMMYVISETPPSLSFNSAINIPEITGCTDCTAENFNSWATSDDGSCIILIEGCTDVLACNYDELSDTDDGSCTYAASGFDCEGTLIEIGALMHGGMVFYIDESGEHGLVAALDDITEGSNMGNYGTADGFEWGCYAQTISGSDGTAIGTGYQNTLDIVAENCQTDNGGITAVQATLNYASEGFTDWYLPSRDELEEMYNTIGNVGSQGNVGGFETSDVYFYWSSTDDYTNSAWVVNFYNGGVDNIYKNVSFRVRAVRAF